MGALVTLQIVGTSDFGYSRLTFYQANCPGQILDVVIDTKSTCNAGDSASILGLARSPGEGNGYPLRYSGLVNSMDSMGSQRVGNMTKLLLSLFFHQVLNELIQVNC